LVIPAHVGSEAGEKDGHVCFEAAGACGDVMAHLMDEKGKGEAERELPAEEGPVDDEEGEEDAQEFELEQEEKGGLDLGEKEGDGGERTEALGPFGLGLFA